MKQSTPLKRKVSLRDSYIRKLREEGRKTVFNKKGKPMVRKPIKKVSKSQRTRLKKYYAIQQEFLSRPENENCRICIVRREHGEDIALHRSTEVHHMASRYGEKLFDTDDFCASCYRCRTFPHENPRLARQYGILK